MDSNGDCRKAGRPRPVTGGQSSRMDALQNQVLFLEAERRRRLELQRIEASLKRIETGDYGYCVTCGEQIPVQRLAPDPTQPTGLNSPSGPADCPDGRLPRRPETRPPGLPV